MNYLSAHYWKEESGVSLVLQQAVRQKGKYPIVFAGIFGEDLKETGKAERVCMAERMTEWFYGRALPDCEKKGAECCVDAVQRLFSDELLRAEKEDGVFCRKIAALFCMGRECFYAWRGTAQIKIFNIWFDRLHMRSLTRPTEEFTCERAVLEEGVGLLLGTEDLFAHLSEETLKACLDIPKMDGETQLERHLAEAAQEAERRGAGETAAVLVTGRG